MQFWEVRICIVYIPDEKRLESSPPPPELWLPSIVLAALLSLLGKKLRLKRPALEEDEFWPLLWSCGSCISPWSDDDEGLFCNNPCGECSSSWLDTCCWRNSPGEGGMLRAGRKPGLIKVSNCGLGLAPLPNLSISWFDRDWLFMWWWSWGVDIWERPNRWLPMLLKEGGFIFRWLSWASASQKARCVMKLSRLHEFSVIV